VLLEGARQGGHRHLGDPADRLPRERIDVPDYEPRGCPRGASFSWYVYSPLRIRYPYVRGALLERYREALATTGDPVDAWASIVDDPVARAAYTSQRGVGPLSTRTRA
jgi:nitrate reductase / nitrite oxidoreductase, alpha subunit